MVKLEGPQNIPSALLDAYRATLTEKQPDAVSRKRYPYRVPHMQEGGADVKAAQAAQRTKFKTAFGNFETATPAERQRWYASRPPWASLLWYYNYFMMSELAGNADVKQGGAGVIKSIKHYTFSMPVGGPSPITVSISTINADKSVVFFYGGGAWEAAAGAFISVYPFLLSLTTTTAIVQAALSNDAVAGAGITVIEYI